MSWRCDRTGTTHGSEGAGPGPAAAPGLALRTGLPGLGDNLEVSFEGEGDVAGKKQRIRHQHRWESQEREVRRGHWRLTVAD